MSEKAINAWLCFVAVSMNLLVMKQITLFGLNVTATDSLAVSYMLGLGMIQEAYGTSAARQHACLALLVCVGFTLLSVFHNLYIPNLFDTADGAYKLILGNMPRLVLASAVSFFFIQILDIALFQYLRSKTKGRWFTGRIGICLILSQALDTVVFSYLGLWGLVENLTDIMIISFIFKVMVTFLSLPFATWAKRLVNKKPHGVVGSNITTKHLYF